MRYICQDLIFNEGISLIFSAPVNKLICSNFCYPYYFLGLLKIGNEKNLFVSKLHFITLISVCVLMCMHIYLIYKYIILCVFFLQPIKGAPAKKRQYKRKKPESISAKSVITNSHGLDIGLGELASSEEEGFSPVIYF